MSFTSWFGNTVTIDQTDKVKNDIFTHAVNLRTNNVKELVRLHNIDVTKYVDGYNQTLLHIATWTSNAELVKFLLWCGCDKTRKNIFGWSPIDNTIKIGNLEIVQMMFANDDIYRMTSTESDRLKRDNKSLLDTNKMLETSLNTMQYKYDAVVVELTNERNHKKRLREECDEYMRENKRIKLDNDRLTNDNKVLEQTINNLRTKK